MKGRCYDGNPEMQDLNDYKNDNRKIMATVFI